MLRRRRSTRQHPRPRDGARHWAQLYRLRSLANACLDEFEQSVRDADHVIDLAPSCADGYYHKGCALYNLRDYAGAAHAFEEGLRLNPTDRILRQAFWDSVTLLTNGRKVQDETE